MSHYPAVKSSEFDVDHSLLDKTVQHLVNEIHAALQISEEDAAKVDHFEFGIRLNPELFVKVYPNR